MKKTFIFTAHLQPCSLVRTLFFVFRSNLTHSFSTEHLLKARWISKQGCARQLLFKCHKHVMKYLECDYMSLPQINMSSRSNSLLNFIFTDSESKAIKTSRENHTGFNLVEIMHFLWSTEEISKSKRSLGFSLRLSKDLQSVSVQTKPQDGKTLIKSNVYPEHLRASIWRIYLEKKKYIITDENMCLMKIWINPFPFSNQREADKYPQCDLFFCLFASNQSELTSNAIMALRMLQKIHISAAPLYDLACYMFHLSSIS